MRVRVFLLPSLLASLLLASPAAAADRWADYVNVRYAFRICYPTDLLAAQGEADNGDGQTFTARDGAQLRVFGTGNTLDRSLTAEAQGQARGYLGNNGRVTYRAATPEWAVISGDDGRANLFYTKTVARGDEFVMFHLRYPKAAAARYKPVVERLSRCFASLDRAGP